jgi:hypothetical protein
MVMELLRTKVVKCLKEDGQTGTFVEIIWFFHLLLSQKK